MKPLYLYIAGAVVAALMALGLWLVFFSSSPTTQTPVGSGDVTYNNGTSISNPSTNNTDNTTGPTVINTINTEKVFKIADGPIAGATLLETSRPTTTVARFVMQTNGHIFDFTIDSPGAIPKAVSNTTIPGIDRVVWSEQGRGVLVQYLEDTVVKTAHLSLPPIGSTTPPVRIQFLPSGIVDLAVSPDGASVVYLMRTESGTDGYTAAANGSNPKKLFTLPLKQTFVSWPSAGTILVQTASAADVAGIAFAVDTKTGGYSPVLYAPGLTANADGSFSRVLYQKVSGGTRSTYAYTVKTGLSTGLSFDPFPERCVWSTVASSTAYCAAPPTYVEASYLDLWHLGAASVADALMSFNLATGKTTVLAVPGSSDGGEEANIAEFAVSPRDQFMSYIRKGDRSLWGVRL